MRGRIAGLGVLALVVISLGVGRAEMTETQPFGLVVHGGAGTLTRARMAPETERAIRATLQAALDRGHTVLAKGGSSLDAVTAAVVLLEDSPLFNAGRGAVYTWEGKHELDASVMDGATRAAGAVAGVRRVRNPIVLARRVMEDSPHVMLVGSGAEEFALSVGETFVDNDYFDTEFRLRQLERARDKDSRADLNILDVDEKFGTVGAVALDRHGNLAAATSTGGTTAKRWGRVGDSPLIGAGTFADNGSCAVSATGHGEYFIRYAVAHDICARMAYQRIPLADAADAVVMKRLVEAGGSGGVIAMDRAGNIAMPFNTQGMYRGYRLGTAAAVIKIFREE